MNLENLFLELIRRQIEEHQMAGSGGRWLLAISGGADSMAMLYALHELSSKCPYLKGLHVAHLNHQLRGEESDGDGDFVIEQSEGLGLPVTVELLDVRSWAHESGESLETAARQLRYQALERIAVAHNCYKVALAHHADDQAETILYRILRGTGIRGLRGMPAIRDLGESLQIVRPLLSCRRDQVEAFLEQKGISHRVDRSNQSTKFTRNKIRLELLPQLQEQFNPNLCDALIRLGQMAQWNQSYLADQIQPVFSRLVIKQSPDLLVLDAQEIRTLAPIVQTEIICEALKALKIGLRPIGYQQILHVLDLVNPKKEGQNIQLPQGISVACKENELKFELIASQKQGHPPSDLIIPLVSPGLTQDASLSHLTIMNDGGFKNLKAIKIEKLSQKSKSEIAVFKDKSSLWELIDMDKCVGQLQLRCRRDSDRFVPLGAPGDKKLGDFFTDCKTPVQHRDSIGLVCDAKGIVWVMGTRISERVKITSKTKNIWRITAIRE
jgi:tRNA(Ile)-lysidine synthase